MVNGDLDRSRNRLPRILVRRVDSYDGYFVLGTNLGATLATLSGLYPILSSDTFPGGVFGKVTSLVGLFLLGGFGGGVLGEAVQRAGIRRLCREHPVYTREIKNYVASLERSTKYHDSDDD